MKSSRNLKLFRCTGVFFALAFLAISASRSEAGAAFTTYSVPGSTYTNASSINSSGEVAGSYMDDQNKLHGYTRDPNGTITSFDPPGSIWTGANCINGNGVVAGAYQIADLSSYGFQRSPDGTIVTFSTPGNVNTNCINSTGEMAGTETVRVGRRKFTIYGFLRAQDGALTTFQIGSKNTGIGALNNSDMAAGNYEVHNQWFGYVRDESGNVTLFQPADSFSTYVSSINHSGTVLGSYIDENNHRHGFIRSQTGSITTIDVPGTSDTYPAHLSNDNSVVGSYFDNSNFNAAHGFLRTPAGKIKPIDVPKSTYTGPVDVGTNGEIVGNVIGSDGIVRAFIYQHQFDNR